jgi:Ca-activated chloride channel homolog
MFVMAYSTRRRLHTYAIVIMMTCSFYFSAKAQITLDDVRSGELLILTTTPGYYEPAPLLSSDIKMNITGMVARVTLSQRFENTSSTWIEAVYVFPLPEDAAVNTLKMRVGERTVEGEIKARDEAQALYNEAKNAGQRTSLVEQERPNLFTTSVANIAPGESVTIEIGYQETLRFDAGSFSLRFPLAITPRYAPGGSEPITTPYQTNSAGNMVTLEATLNAGFPLSKLESRYHAVNTWQDDNMYRVMLNGPVTADRDFELVWTPDIGTLPEAVAFSETWQGEPYALLMLMPPQLEGISALAREVTLIIDTSGSMEGISIVQAKEAVRLALIRLKPTDRFNVIAFSDTATPLFSMARDASSENIRLAESFVSQLVASGGTEMKSALELAFQNQTTQGYLGQIVFVTDGSVSNEAELFSLIERRLGSARLFTVGIGSALNSYFMRKAAEFGRGTYTFISDLSETQEQMNELFVKLEQPVLMGLELNLPAGSEVFPSAIPDLYQGEPIVISVKLPAFGTEAILEGNMNGEHWTRSISLLPSETETGVSQLWARAKIDTLSDEMIRGGNSWQLQQDIVALGLKHHLVTAYTSLVVVDNEVPRLQVAPLESQEVPQVVPQGQTLSDVGNIDAVMTDAAMPVQAGQVAPAETATAVALPTSEAVMTEAEITTITVDTPEADARAVQLTTEQSVAVPQPQSSNVVAVVPVSPTTSTPGSSVDTSSLEPAPLALQSMPAPRDSKTLVSVAVVMSLALLLGAVWLAQKRRRVN